MQRMNPFPERKEPKILGSGGKSYHVELVHTAYLKKMRSVEVRLDYLHVSIYVNVCKDLSHIRCDHLLHVLTLLFQCEQPVL